jgi:hypothetical protein
MKIFSILIAASCQASPIALDSDDMITIVDCDGERYSLPRAGSDAEFVDKLMTESLNVTDANGMGQMILKMAKVKATSLWDIVSRADQLNAIQSSLHSLLGTDYCTPSSDDVHSDTVSDRYGENTGVFREHLLEDEPKSLVTKMLGKVRRQRRYKREKKPRMFHSDQIDMKVKDILPGKEDILHVYEGDMLYHKKFVERKTGSDTPSEDTVMWSPWSLWPNGQVNWYVNPTTAVDECAVATFRTSASMIEKYTCLRFTEGVIPSSSVDSIQLTSEGTGCWAYVGMSESSQVNLGGAGCQIPGIALHEVGHAIGLIHQQSRQNRDQYVTIEWDNIKDSAVNNFYRILSPGSSYQSTVGSQPYDYASIMHYSACEFSTTRSSNPCGETIHPADATVTKSMGQRSYLSQLDITTINSMYGCTTTCADGIQNQGEEGVDCGGPCRKVCGDDTTDGIVALPALCEQTEEAALTQTDIIIIASVCGSVAIILGFIFYKYMTAREERKEDTKQKLLKGHNMSVEQLRNVLKQRSQTTVTQPAVSSDQPSAPPP